MFENPTFPTSAPVFDGRGFLVLLKARGIVLEAGPGGKIRFDAPAGTFTPELRAAVAEHRAELLELLAAGPHGSQDLQPQASNGDAAGPVTAGSDPSDAGPSGTDRLAGQALPGADPLGAARSQDAHGDAGQAHGDAGGADGPQEPATVRQATAGPRMRPAVPVAVEWPAAAADFALLLAVDDLPPVPFRLNAWTVVQDAAKFLRWLQADARRGPIGPRAFYGALQADVQALQRFALQAADDQQRSETRKAGKR